MKIIKNEKLMERNARIGQYTSLGGLVAMGIGVYSAITGMFKPETVTTRSELTLLGSMVFGILLAQVGTHYGIRYGKSPRPDEKIDAGLKGLHSEFNLYHYSTPASHLLIGPAGVWVLLPYHQRGKVGYTKHRWRLSGGGFLQGYLRLFGQEGLGRPDAEAASDISSVKRFLAKKLEAAHIPEIKAMLIFTAEHIDLDAGDSPIPALKLKQVKDFLRQESKKRALSSEQITEITALLPD